MAFESSTIGEKSSGLPEKLSDFLTPENIFSIISWGEDIDKYIGKKDKSTSLTILRKKYLTTIYQKIRDSHIWKEDFISRIISNLSPFLKDKLKLSHKETRRLAEEVYYIVHKKPSEIVIRQLPELRKEVEANDGDDFTSVAWIKAFQKRHGISNDGILWSITLKKIYSIYFKEWRKNELPLLIRHRLEAYEDMKKYPSWKRVVRHLWEKRVTLYPSHIPNALSDSYYFGQAPGKPINGGAINSDLLNRVSPHDSSVKPTTYLRKLPGKNGKFILITYIGWKLVFASYTSPGILGKFRTPNIWEVNGDRKGQFSKKYWISWAKASVKWRNGRFESAPMPYAVNILDGIFSHGGNTNGNRRSHGCLRLPLHYAKHMYEIFNKTWRKMTWIIEDR